jgi:hypothetical protein
MYMDLNGNKFASNFFGLSTVCDYSVQFSFVLRNFQKYNITTLHYSIKLEVYSATQSTLC